MDVVEFRLFGEPSCTFGGKPWPMRGLRRVYEVIALCALSGERGVSRESAAAQLWPDEDREDARANLRRHLSRLQSLLPPLEQSPIVADAAGLRWNPNAPAWVDAIEFERLAATPDRRHEAVALYRGDLLEPIYEDWILSQRERLRAQAVNMSQALGTTALREGDYVSAREHAQRALDLGEWREDSLRLVMTALYALGDRVGALAAFDRFVETLQREMHVNAMPETIALRDAMAADIPIPQTLPEASADLPGEDAHRFVGRDDELAELRSAWERAKRRAGNTIFIGGEAGIGKSRLCGAIARIATQDDGRVLWGYAPPDGSSAYQPLVDVTKSALPVIVSGDVDDVWLAALADLVPEVTRLRPSVTARDDEGARRAERLHEAFSRVVDAAASRRPTLVILEDLHWADADTLDAVAYLARRIRGSSVLLLLTHRSEETPLSHPLRSVRRRLLAEHRASMLALVPLRHEAVRDLAAHVIEDASDYDALAESALEATGGNPLFVLQFLNNYRERSEPAAPGAGGGVERLIDSRLARLSHEERSLLQLAALVDTRFTIEELAAISGIDEASVQRSVDVLLDRQYIRWWSQPSFTLTFSHQLLRERSLAGAPRDGRVALHRRIARTLQETRTSDDAASLLVARHFELGGDTGEAFRRYHAIASSRPAQYAPSFAIETAQSALRVASTDAQRFEALRVALTAHQDIGAATPAYREAATAFVAAAADLGDEERFEASIHYASFCVKAGDGEAMERASAELIARAEATGDAKHLVRAYDQVGNRHIFSGRLRKAIAAFETALSHATEESVLTFRIRSSLVSCYLRSGDAERGIALLEDLERLADSFDDARVQLALGTAEQNLAVVLERIDYFEAAGTRLVSAADRIGALSPKAVGMSLLCHAAYRRGNVVDGRALAAQTRAFMETHAIMMNRIAVGINMTLSERELGNIDEAIAQWRGLLADARRHGSESGQICCLVNIADALVDRGDTREAIDLSREALRIIDSSGEHRLAGDAYIALGRALVTSGDRRQGIEALRNAVASHAEVGVLRSLSQSLSELVEALLAEGSTAEALERGDALRAIYERGREFTVYPAAVCFALAGAADAAGDDAAARRYRFEAETLAKTALAAIPDEATRANYAAMPHNRRILDGTLVGSP